MEFISNINAPIFTLSAIAIGYLLIDDATPAEQNAIGGWFMLVGQTLCTNSGQQQLINNANGTSNSSNRHIINDDAFNQHNNVQQQIDMLKKVVSAMQQQINDLQKNI